MKSAHKAKVSVTISSDLLAQIDREAKRGDLSRSEVLDRWLRLASTRRANEELELQTIAYYLNRTDDDRAEDEAIAAASSRAARRRRID